jgi:hypothetical protein
MIETYNKPQGEELDMLKTRILSSRNIFFIDGEYDFDGSEEMRALIFYKGKILFVSSRILVPNGISMVINPREISKDDNLRDLQYNVLDDLQHGELRVAECTSYKDMLTKLKKIGKLTGTTSIYDFFKKSRNRQPIEGMMKLNQRYS